MVWDKAASIRYLMPGRGDAFARFRLNAAAIARVRKATAQGAKTEPTFQVKIVDRAGDVVAEVEKTLSIRRRPQVPPAAAAGRRTAGRRATDGVIAR